MNAPLSFPQRSPRSWLTPLSEIEARSVDWLWEPYLPKGMLSLLSGDPGGGKTFLSLAIAAALSNGHAPSGNIPCEPISTIYLSRENSPNFVVRPRFDLLHGNADRFFVLDNTLSLTDIFELETSIREVKAGLVIVDPFQSFVGSDVDIYRANETRPILDGLSEIAGNTGCCILVVRHLSKGSGGRAIHRGLGSIDITGAARTELLAGTAPNNENERAMIQVKSNIGPYGDPLGFRINADGLEWSGKSSLTIMDLLSADHLSGGKSQSDRAIEWLKGELASGPQMQTDLVARSAFEERTLQRAGKALGIRRSRVGDGGPWQWELP
jgi:hypothetical protein